MFLVCFKPNIPAVKTLGYFANLTCLHSKWCVISNSKKCQKIEGVLSIWQVPIVGCLTSNSLGALISGLSDDYRKGPESHICNFSRRNTSLS